jgi:hypothetical protein
MPRAVLRLGFALIISFISFTSIVFLIVYGSLFFNLQFTVYCLQMITWQAILCKLTTRL